MKGWKIRRIFGIDIEIHLTWFLILGYLVWFFAGNYFPALAPNQSPALYWLFGIATAVVFLFSVLFHELSHSMVAKLFKIPIERITLFIFGGAAQMSGGPKSAKAEIFMAAAGPISSVVLAGIFWLIMNAGLNVFAPLALASLNYLVLINVILAGFNLIPAFPMDGGRVFRAVCWWKTKSLAKATKIAKNVAIVFAVILPIGGFFFGGLFMTIWLGVIFWFILIPAGQSEYRAAVLEEKLKEVSVKEVMERENFLRPGDLGPEIICHPGDRLKTVYERMVATRKPEFYVMENGAIVGRITLGGINRYLNKKTKR